VLLDLKETDRALLDQLVRYLTARAGARDVMISSRDRAALRYLSGRLPRVALLLTAAWPSDVAQLRRAGALADVVDGVSAYERLLDADLVGWLHERDLKILAWPVNDQARLAALARAGVDGVTTDNLAIIDALARRQ
jgi:glycerophosphoryl diester phosphodiesterase